MNKVFVEGGKFQMGSNSERDNEKPIHSVTIKSFNIGKYPVTQKEWHEIMGSSPSNFKGDNLPVERVNWYDAIEFCNKKSTKEGLTPVYSGSRENITVDWNVNGYRLPAEAEWEYAACGGNKSRGHIYSGSGNIAEVAWYGDEIAGKTTHLVGTKNANELGIHDLNGNVWEWCWDWYDGTFYSQSSSTDPTGPAAGEHRVLRGGSWFDAPESCRVSLRNAVNPQEKYSTVGFRLANSVDEDIWF